ncbi:MAG: substrate-binding domain-containing protein [Azospirillaceae bacterium]
MTDHGKPTIKDVARAAGTSIGTVSRVLNAHPNVTPLSRQRVMRAVQSLGYEPNLAAQSMRTRTKKAIGFMVNDIANPLFAKISRHAETLFHENGYSLLLANTAGKTSTEIDLVEQFFKHRTDAILLSLADETNPALLQALRGVDIPIVVMDREPEGIDVDRVMTDHGQGMRQATEYLIRLGHRRIGLITADRRISPGRARLDGYLEAHRKAGVSVDPRLIRARTLSAEFGFQEASSLLAAADRPTALIAGGNQILVGAMRAIRQHGIALPHDLSLVSCDDTELTELAGPPITVIWRDLGLIGRTAADLLLQRLAADAGWEPRRILLPTELLVRESCAPPNA